MALVRRPARTLSALFGSLALAGALMVVGAGTAGAAPSILRVGCGHGSYPTIGAAVGAAASGETIMVCPGTYPGGVVVSRALSIVGVGHPVIDATGQDNGVQVLASGSRIQGLTVENAIGEGILVGLVPAPVSHVTISGNTVKHNDRGNPAGAPITNSSYPQCNANPATPTTPGDCGEGIHLANAFDSTVVGNTVVANSGGILLSDDTGPTYGNLVAFNDVSGNVLDCGITIAGHTPEVFGGGVHDNKILANRVTGNGVAGQGGGVLLATGVPGNVPGIPGTGGAVYNNLVQGNYLAGNGLGGVTLHSHAPGENLNGNTITGNTIGTNNLDPDMDFAGFGPQFFDGQTTGVIVAAASNVTITIARNLIFNNVNGVWLGQVAGATITAAGTASNRFVNVTNPVVTVS
ncbi:MAG: right-handed parallel beta-helix repeat-containing protein [Streptosporangiaceae bacterium]